MAFHNTSTALFTFVEPPQSMRDFILTHLSRKGIEGDYVYRMYRQWKAHQKAIHVRRGSYDSFRRIIWGLKNECLIERIPDSEKTPEELYSGLTYPRAYYRRMNYC
jgi:hypothetical protein